MNQYQQPYDESDKPPIFKTWKQLYTIVIGQLALLIILFYFITKYFS